jgi:hypothetical protein
MVMVSVCVAVLAGLLESVTVTLKLLVAAVVGVPVIAVVVPEVDNPKPAGREPEVTVQE